MPKKRVVSQTEAVEAVANVLPGERDVDTVLVDQAVQNLNRLYLAKGLETARAVGEYVVETFFGGDTESFERGKNEHESFKALSEREDLKVSKSLLWYSVRLLPQLQLLPTDIGLALPMSHHRLLLHVGDDKLKVQLAKKAVEGDLSKRDFETEIKRARKKAGDTSNAGRKPLPNFQKTVSRLGRILEKGDAAFADLDKVDGLAQADALKLYQTVTGMKLKCEELQKALQQRAGL